MQEENHELKNPNANGESSNMPNFQNKAINFLYKSNEEIDYNILKEILNSDRESTIEDLNKVLKDSINRFSYFSNKSLGADFTPNDSFFLLHALFLLGELKATESLENVFQILSQDYDFVDFYIGDFLTEHLDLVLYKIGNKKLDRFKEFVLKPGIDPYIKGVASQMAALIAFHQPERREEIIAWYREIFEFFLANTEEEDVFDSNLIGLMVADLIDIRAEELLSEIEELFDKNMVDVGVCGDMIDVEEEIVKSIKKESIPEINGIFKIYSILKDEEGNMASDLDSDFEEYIKPSSHINIGAPKAKEAKKIGRNDPCPCGSGLKYKNCCMVVD